MKIKLQNVRLSFPSLFRKAVFSGEETKYEATLLINKETQADLIKQIGDAIKEKIKVDLKGAKLPADKICMKDGENIEYDGYAGHWSI
ncbi:MAG TPA: ssDNA-binding protein, partial [Orrella sp.]